MNNLRKRKIKTDQRLEKGLFKGILSILTALVCYALIISCVIMVTNKRKYNQLTQESTNTLSMKYGEHISSNNESVLNEMSEDIYGNYVKSGQYFSIIDLDNLKNVLESINYENGKFEWKKLYDFKDFSSRLEKIRRKEFLEILKTLKYDTNDTKQEPTSVLSTRSGNCSAITLFIYNWLLVNYNPNEYKYYINIVEEATDNTNYDGHMYLRLKKEGKKDIIVDFSTNELKEESISELERFITK